MSDDNGKLIVDGTILPSKIDPSHILTNDFFDPPLDGAHMEQVQKAINLSLTEDRANRPAYPYEEGDVLVVGPGIFSAKDRSVLNWDGVNYVPQAVAPEHVPLKEYKTGDRVEVFVNGDWMKGFVQSVDKTMNLVFTHTDRGPRTVASTKGIRRA